MMYVCVCVRMCGKLAWRYPNFWIWWTYILITLPPQIKLANDSDENEEMQWVGKLLLCIAMYD